MIQGENKCFSKVVVTLVKGMEGGRLRKHTPGTDVCVCVCVRGCLCADLQHVLACMCLCVCQVSCCAVRLGALARVKFHSLGGAAFCMSQFPGDTALHVLQTAKLRHRLRLAY